MDGKLDAVTRQPSIKKDTFVAVELLIGFLQEYHSVVGVELSISSNKDAMFLLVK
jgi:hypothetical protein